MNCDQGFYVVSTAAYATGSRVVRPGDAVGYAASRSNAYRFARNITKFYRVRHVVRPYSTEIPVAGYRSARVGKEAR